VMNWDGWTCPAHNEPVAAPAPPPADAVRALVAKLEQPRTLSMFMGAHDMALALVQERAEIARDLAALSAAPSRESTRYRDFMADLAAPAGEESDCACMYYGLGRAPDLCSRHKKPAAAPTPEGDLTARAWQIVEQVAGAGIGGSGQMIGGPSRCDAQDLIAERDQQEGGR
jgi:hypothetical protein